MLSSLRLDFRLLRFRFCVMPLPGSKMHNKAWLEQPAISGVVEVFGIRHLFSLLKLFRQRVPAHRRSN
jgi:hypothetical protein